MFAARTCAPPAAPAHRAAERPSRRDHVSNRTEPYDDGDDRRAGGRPHRGGPADRVGGQCSAIRLVALEVAPLTGRNATVRVTFVDLR